MPARRPWRRHAEVARLSREDYPVRRSKNPREVIRDTGTARRAIFLALLSLLWGFIVFQYGGVVAWDQKLYLLALGILTLAYWLMARDCAAGVPSLIRWAACLLPLYIAFQLVPLPGLLISVLSPGRYELMRGLMPLVPGEKTATLSVVPGATMSQFLLVCGYALVFFMTSSMATDWAERRWIVVAPLGLVAVSEAVLGILQAVGEQRARGTYVNPDHYAGLLEMALPFTLTYPLAVWRKIDTRRGFPIGPAVRMCLSLGMAAVILMGTLASLSRMGFIAPLFSVLVMGIVAWWGTGWRSAGLAVLLALALVGTFIFLPSNELISRFSHASQEISAEGRTMLWRESLQVLRAFPIFGCGLGGFESAFLRYKISTPMVRDNYAHNDYLQFLIELGIVGFAIGVVLFASIFSRTWRIASRRRDPGRRFLALGCLGALTAIGLHSFVDFNLYIPANAMLLAWIAGVASSLNQDLDGNHLAAIGLPVTIDIAPQAGGASRRT